MAGKKRIPNWLIIVVELLACLTCANGIGYCAATLFMDVDTVIIKTIGIVVFLGLAWMLGFAAFYRITHPSAEEPGERKVLTIEELEKLTAEEGDAPKRKEGPFE